MPESAEALRARLRVDCDLSCPSCGYNLRGTEDGMCPECGFGFDETLIERSRVGATPQLEFRDVWFRVVQTGLLVGMFAQIVAVHRSGVLFALVSWPWRRGIGLVPFAALGLLVGVRWLDGRSEAWVQESRWPGRIFMAATVITGLYFVAVFSGFA